MTPTEEADKGVGGVFLSRMYMTEMDIGSSGEQRVNS